MGLSLSKKKSNNYSSYEPKINKPIETYENDTAVFIYNALSKRNYLSLENKLSSNILNTDYFGIPIGHWLVIHTTIFNPNEFLNCLQYFERYLHNVNKTKKNKPFYIRFEINNGTSQLFVNILHEKSFVYDNYLSIPALNIADLCTFIVSNICKVNNKSYIKFIGINSSMQSKYKEVVEKNINCLQSIITYPSYAQSHVIAHPIVYSAPPPPIYQPVQQVQPIRPLPLPMPLTPPPPYNENECKQYLQYPNDSYNVQQHNPNIYTNNVPNNTTTSLPVPSAPPGIFYEEL